MFVNDHGVLEVYIHGVDRGLNNTFFDNILSTTPTGTISVIVYSSLNVPAPVGVRAPAPTLVGLFAGVASPIPVVGVKLVYVPVAGYIGFEVATANLPELRFALLFATVSFVIMDTTPDLAPQPYVSGQNLHAGAVMLAYMFGPLFLG